MTRRVQIFVAEDQPLYLEAVENAIGNRPDLELVGSAADGRRALEEIRRLEPQVALLGMGMGGLAGPEVLNAIIRDKIPTRVVFLSNLTESGLVFAMFSRGAAGYLDKASSAEEICNAIMAVSRGEMVISPTVEGGVLQQIRLHAVEQPTLTEREREVLRLVATGLSAPEIANRLFIEPSTVKSHLHNIYEKLGVSDRAAAVAEGMRRGLLE
jgi:two-component system, NarL family, nitrate/nitrite response regulator NarL